MLYKQTYLVLSVLNLAQLTRVQLRLGNISPPCAVRGGGDEREGCIGMIPGS